MAFTFINAAHAASTAATTLTCNKPTDTADGDIMFAVIHRNYDQAVTLPDGWALIATHLGSGGGPEQHTLYWKLAASEGASYDWVWATSKVTTISIATFRGAFNPADPIDVVSNTDYLINNTACRAASMTVADINSPLVFFGLDKGSAATFTKPSVPTSGWVEHVDYCDTTNYVSREICGMLWASSGATGTMDATLSSARAATKHAFAVALTPEVVIRVTGATLVSPTIVDVQFDGAVGVSAETEANWTITKAGGGAVPSFTCTIQVDTTVVRIEFATPLSGVYSIEATSVLDAAGTPVHPDFDTAVVDARTIRRSQAWVF